MGHDHNHGHDHAHDHEDHSRCGHDHDHGHSHSHGHSHAHSHGHSHGGHHHHVPSDFNRAFAVGVGLNVLFVIVEVIYGLLADSLALLADAGHNLSDVVGLLLAWGAAALAKRKATEKRTYGMRKATVIASLGSAVLLIFALGGIATEAIGRFWSPAPVAGAIVITVAAIGVVINTLTALMFMRGQKDDLNIRGAFLHMAADALVSLGVVVAGVLMLAFGWSWLDPLMSLAIVAVILGGTWGLLRDSMNYAMDAVPDSVDLPALRAYLTGLPSVERIHDLHVWPLSTTEIALTVHLVVSSDQVNNPFLSALQKHLRDRFGIAHATIQVETAADDSHCMLDQQRCV